MIDHDSGQHHHSQHRADPHGLGPQIKRDHGHLKLKARAETEAWLVFNESFFPGWVASIDGRKTEIYPANYLFQAVLVPAGEHEVSFDYKYAEVIKSLLKK